MPGCLSLRHEHLRWILTYSSYDPHSKQSRNTSSFVDVCFLRLIVKSFPKKTKKNNWPSKCSLNSSHIHRSVKIDTSWPDEDIYLNLLRHDNDNDFELSRFAFALRCTRSELKWSDCRDRFAAQRHNIYFTNLDFSVHTVIYKSSYFPPSIYGLMGRLRWPTGDMLQF